MEGRHVLSQLYQISNDVAHFHHMIMISNILTSNQTNLYDWVGFLQLLGFYSETGPKREMVVRSIFTILPIACMFTSHYVFANILKIYLQIQTHKHFKTDTFAF